MPGIHDDANESKVPTPDAFRHLPRAVALEDTVESVPSDVPFRPTDERNAFIEAAVQAGG
jgi:hypothetical protein